jgi:hypothetical protein
MKKQLLLAVLFTGAMTVSAHAGVNVDINLGIPVPLPPTVVVQTPPEFIYSPSLGFYVSVGAPYDIVYLGSDYYLYRDGYYYRSRSYNGPWVGVEGRRLPPGLRRHRYEEIRRYRDGEYRRFNHDRAHYNGRWYKPGGARGEGHGGEHRGNPGHGGEHRGNEGHGGGHHGGDGHGGEGRR